MRFQQYKYLNIVSLVLILSSCNKLIDIPEPIDTITTVETFSTDALATSAINGLYSNMSWFAGNGIAYANGLITIDAGLSADELIDFAGFNTFQSNQLLATEPSIASNLWSAAYKDIYVANSIIEGLKTSSGVSDAVKKQLTGEAEFIRAFCHFYLVNLFGDVPLVTTTAWAKTALIKRTPASDVYKQIIADLTDAQSLLNTDYSFSNEEHIRANKWAATALLARVRLYTQDWQDAETQATAVIDGSGLYSLSGDLNETFLKNSNEAILQLQTINLDPWCTWEGHNLIPTDQESAPNFYLTDQLLAAFETGDQRRVSWTDSTIYSGTTYYFPYKYKIRVGEPDNVNEYYTLLRFAELYLIRAEARAQENHLEDAVADLNVIRDRALLPPLSLALNQTEVLAAVAQERRVELFAEWGHRWLDIKRTGQATSVLQSIKPGWSVNAELYPIPSIEITSNPNLTQNQGY